MRILLIDDEPGVTENLVEYLEEDHQVEVMNHVVDEKHLQQSLEEFRPEAAILDYDMVPNGFALYGWIAAWRAREPQRSSIQIVFYTKYAGSPWHREKMLEAGAQENQIVPKVEAADDVARLLRVLRRP